jgi:chromosome segregation ATPase
MPDTRKPSRPSKDPRVDSSPPPREEVPLARGFVRPSQPSESVGTTRVASLEAELDRIRAERASEADEAAGMLVQIAESDRMRAAAQTKATAASERAEALRADLDHASHRISELEAEVDALRQQWAQSEARLSEAQETMSSALGLLEAMERREEMASSLRARALRDAVQALGRSMPPPPSHPEAEERPASGVESTVEVLGTQDLDWDMALGDSD